MKKEKLKNAVRYFYDLQMLRMQSGSRASKKAKIAEACLDDDDKAFLKNTGAVLKALEKSALKEVERLLKGIPIYERYLKDAKGIGPTLSGIIISEIHIENCNTVSQLWSWGGLATQRICRNCDALIEEKPHQTNLCPKCGSDEFYHQSARRRKGEKLGYNPWLKAKLLKVMGDCLIKVAGLDASGYYTSVQVKGPDGKGLWEDELDLNSEPDGKKKKVMEHVAWKGTPPIRKFYDDYKRRKENETVKVCMGCKGSGVVVRIEKDEVVEQGTKKPRKNVKCPNCEGVGGPAPWGASKAHRAAAANRYMVKMFLLDLWKFWRELEGLEVPPPYAEEYLDKKAG